jgi:putative lipoic acid-binding regulatory protein
MKVIGKNENDFERFVIHTVGRHVPFIDAGPVRSRESSQGKYLSVTLTFIAESRAQLNAIYSELGKHPRVLFIL